MRWFALTVSVCLVAGLTQARLLDRIRNPPLLAIDPVDVVEVDAEAEDEGEVGCIHPDSPDRAKLIAPGKVFRCMQDCNRCSCLCLDGGEVAYKGCTRRMCPPKRRN